MASISARSIPPDEHDAVLIGHAPYRGATTAVSRLASAPFTGAGLPLERLEKACLVGLDDSRELVSHDLKPQCQKPKPASKGRAASHVQPLRRLGDADALDKHPPVLDTALALALSQSDQRSSSQCVKRLAACAALVALKSARHLTSNYAQAVAVRAHPQCLQPLLDVQNGLPCPLGMLEPVHQLLLLPPAQLLNRKQHRIELPIARRIAPPGISGAVPLGQFGWQVAHHVSLSLLNAHSAQNSG